MNEKDLKSDRKCPHCDYKNDGTTVLENEEASPHAGDFSVCINCAKVSAFKDDMHLRLLTEDETKLASKMSTLNRAIKIIKKLHEDEKQLN